MSGVDVRSTEPLLALDTELGKAGKAIEESVATAKGKAARMLSQLQAAQTRCQGKLRHWQNRIDSADEEEDTSPYYEQLEIWEEKLSVARDSIACVEGSWENLQSSIRQLETLASEKTARARAFLRQRVSEIEDYSALQAIGGDSSATSMGGSGGRTITTSTSTSDFRTGYRRTKRDSRDWLWSKLYGPVPPDLPERVGLESFLGPASDQKDTPQCVCYSLAALKHHDALKSSGHWLQFDPNPIYQQCKTRDGASAQDGTTIRDAMKVAVKTGLVADDGRRYFIKGYARIENVDEICHALSLHKVVMLGLQVSGSDLSSLDKNAIASIPASTNGGHCMLVTGYDAAHRLFRIRNSWGTEWADAGHCWVPFGYLATDPDFDAWTTACERAEAKEETHSETPIFPCREISPTSNYAWFNPQDLTLDPDDGANLEWTRITPEVAQATLDTIIRMRPYVAIANLKSSNLLSTRDALSQVVNVSGEKAFTEADLRAFDLYYGSDAIRIDSDGKGGFTVINGRHRVYLAQQAGIQSIPVSISNLARKQLSAVITEQQ